MPWKSIKHLKNELTKWGSTIYNAIQTVNDPVKMSFENIVKKRESAGHQHFLLFPQYFVPILKGICFKLHLFC